MSISVIVPCYNEAGNIIELTSRLDRTLSEFTQEYEIILVDDCSLDKTWEEITYVQKLNSKVKPILHLDNLGMANAWKTGLHNSCYEYSCLIDADLQYQPEDILRLYNEIKFRQPDMVQGARVHIGELKNSRFILSKGLNFLLNFIFSMRLKDNKSGFVLARRDILLDILNTRFSYKTLQTFITISAKSKCYKISEIDVIFKERLVGNSFVSTIPIKLIGNVLLDLIKGFYEFRISKKKTTILSDFVKDNSLKGAPERSVCKKILLLIYFYTMPLHAWLISRNIRTYYNELSKSQWLSREKILELQLEKFKKLIFHAYYHVEYYRDLFDKNNIKPSDIKNLDDIRKIPFLTKDIINNNINGRIIATNVNRKEILKIVTSGSTGVPFTCYADKFQLEMRWASTLRSLEWTGYVFGDRCARLWHQTIGMNFSQIIRESIDAFLSRRIFIPAYSIKKNNLEKYLKKLESYKPVLIDGYAESFNCIAQYIQSGRKIKINPKGVISSAQILPEQSRLVIEEAFNTKVYDKYGSREFSGIAYESIENDVHLVVAENYFVEILNNGVPALPGEVGEVYITDLNNYCLPFIRYKIGDLAVAVEPSRISKCGRGLPLIGKIEGRVQAIIVGDNDKYLPGTFFAHFFKEYPHVIKQYQIIQENYGSVILKIIKADRYTEDQFSKILISLRNFLGVSIDVQVEFLDQIPLGRTGKHQGAISYVKHDLQSNHFCIEKNENINYR
jgi:phenylacetate-CoA ligase